MSEYLQTPQLRPLTQTDNQVLDLVYDCYVVNKPGETFNAEALFSVVSDIMSPSIGAADPSIRYDVQEKDKAFLANFEPPTHLLKHIACQMTETRHDEYHSFAHETTMRILKDLDAYSWFAKAVTALAAFALEYGNFWHLFQVPKEDNLGRSLAVLNHVQAFERSRRDIYDYNLVVKAVFLTVECIVKLERMSKQGYDVKDIPTMEIAIHEFPVFVYWTVLTIVVLASYIDILLGYSISTYELSNISSKISTVLIKLKDYLAKIESEKGLIDEYLGRNRVVFQTPTEIVQVLKCLLCPKDLKDPQVYDGSTGAMVSIEVFRQKYVLLFISGLYSIADEIRLLKSINEGLKKDPKEVKGFRKEDFKILWAPIVEDGEITDRKQFEDLKRQMEWYVAEYSMIPPVCKKLIRERLRYQNKPIVPVFNPQGRRTNDNALHMLFAWGDPAFPWGKDDDLALNQRWNWFWAEMKKINPKIENWIKDEAYIIIYGRTDSDYCDDRWLLNLPDALEKIKRDETTKRADVVINYYHHGKGKDERKIVDAFWAYVENLFDSMRKKTTKDSSFDEVKAFLGLRQEQSGWVLLSKGSNVKLLCRGDSVYQTIKDFDSWKQNIESDPGFDVSFGKYYEIVISKLPPHAHCLRLDLKTHVSDIYVPVYCMLCNRQMDIELVRYVCCHGYKEETVDTSGGTVPIFR